MKIRILLLITLYIGFNAAYGAAAEPDQKTIKSAVEKYLNEKGHLCLGKFVWPIEVSEHDRQLGSNNAIQMPVLEKLGLVKSSATLNEPGVHDYDTEATRYELTTAGKKYYLAQPMTSIDHDDQPPVHQGDFCAADLSLNRVISWQAPQVVNGHKQITVTYTYKVKAAEWTRDADIQRVFPRVDQVIRGAGTLQLKEAFTLTNNIWIASGPET